MAAATPIHRLDIKLAFDSLSHADQVYAHHLSRAAWHGARTILTQTSPEANSIFDLILELHEHCSGDWSQLGTQAGVSQNDVATFLHYAGEFLSNIRNYYGSGDQKFVPQCSIESVKNLASASEKAIHLFQAAMPGLFEIPPYSLGYLKATAQSMYYPGPEQISPTEISDISKRLDRKSLFPENTRLQKALRNGVTEFHVLQASIETDEEARDICSSSTSSDIKLVRGDHSIALSRINGELILALQSTSDRPDRRFVLEKYIESFRTGDLEAYRDSQRAWVKDVAPRIENIFGFVEPYRDPHGIRAEFEGIVAISNPEETKALTRLVDNSSTFIKRLPWVQGATENDGKGPFEKETFEPPDLPAYTALRTVPECGFKNVIIANRMSSESKGGLSPYIDAGEAETFRKHKYPAHYLWVVLHELLGHGTSKLLVEQSEGNYNFNVKAPPINPLTSKPIDSWYRPGQTWTSQFQDLATTVDECRAELVGAYLIDDAELLELFGYTKDSAITSADITYNTYQQLGVDGLRGLQNYNLDDQKWGQAHSRAHFATLKWLLQDSQGFMTVAFDSDAGKLSVQVDRSKLTSHGKPSIDRMLLRLHIYRCTADVNACRNFYENLSKVDGQYLEWRKVILANSEPKLKYVQANTFLTDTGDIELREYNATDLGIIKSWADRSV